MKRLWLLLVLLLILPISLRAERKPIAGLGLRRDVWEDNLTIMYVSESMEAIELLKWSEADKKFTASPFLIKQLAKEGEICKVFGHWWVEDRYSEVYSSPSKEPVVWHRHCRICGKSQRGVNQPSMNWKDE